MRTSDGRPLPGRLGASQAVWYTTSQELPDWYEPIRAYIRRVAGTDRGRVALVAHGLAFWQERANLDSALNRAIAAQIACRLGAPRLVVGTRRQATRYRAACRRGELPPLPPKARPLVQWLGASEFLPDAGSAPS